MKKNFLSSMSVTVHMEILSLLFSSLTRKIHVISLSFICKILLWLSEIYFGRLRGGKIWRETNIEENLKILSSVVYDHTRA